MLLRQGLPGAEEELQCRRLQRGVRAAALGQGESGHLLRLLRRQQPQGQIAQRIRQGQRGAVVLRLRRLVVRQQCGEELRRFLGIAVFQRGRHHQLGGEANVTDLLGRQLVVGIEQQIQILGPQGELGLLHRRLSRRGGQLLLIAQAEFGHHLPHQRRRLTADIPVRVQQQFIEKIHRLDLLIGGQIGGIRLQHTQICPHTGPVLLAAGLFQQIGKQPLMAEPAHHVQVVLHRHQAEGAVIGVRRHQGDVRLLLRRRVTALQRYVHAPGAQILLEIPQLAVDVLIAARFGGVHVVQLVEDHVKGVLQGVQRRRLPAVFLPPLLGAEVSVDQQHGFHRKVGQFQIPCGVVAGHLPHLGQPGTGQPLVGVVVVQIRHPLPGHTAEFSDVVSGGRRRGEPQIHCHAAAAQGAPGGHGHMVHHGDMLQSAERRQLAAQPQQLIDEVLPPHLQKPGIEGTARRFRFGAEGKVQLPIEGQRPPLLLQQQLQRQQGTQGKVLLLRCGVLPPPGIQTGRGVAEHIRAPSALRSGNIIKQSGGGLDHAAAVQTLRSGQKAFGKPFPRPPFRHGAVMQAGGKSRVAECVRPVLPEYGSICHIDSSSSAPSERVRWYRYPQLCEKHRRVSRPQA